MVRRGATKCTGRPTNGKRRTTSDEQQATNVRSIFERQNDFFLLQVGSQCTILTDNYCEDAYHLLQTPLLKNLLMDEKKERRRFADGEKESKTMEQAWVVGQGGTGSGLRIE
ncbi:hypothetical protein E6C27_scaffold138G00230 [Cucumis melo var. makuwa]|uniref:Uncharacterized protein n=1 Tax=Cucumis melo var. makuwa TaxID=1194695 RepID=A0A5A7VIE0_CUCMM|nr:hypothetical protein E6C27_scaffold138G00230 [Cucumis melo var. makuwa]